MKAKPLAWLHGEVKTPPLSREARIEAGFLLRVFSVEDRLQMPHSRPMPSIGETPKHVIETCKKRFKEYDNA